MSELPSDNMWQVRQIFGFKNPSHAALESDQTTLRIAVGSHPGQTDVQC